MIPRVGERIIAGMQYRQRHGAYAILVRKGHVLLTHQEKPRPEVQLPGGGIDPGEQPLVALSREIREETGWTIDAPRRIGAFRRFAFMPDYDLWAEKVCHVYLARPALKRHEPTEPHHTAIWAPLSVAASLLANAGDRAFMTAVAETLRTRGVQGRAQKGRPGSRPIRRNA